MRPLDDRYTGYATENVTPITALDKVSIDELWDELTARLHHHNEYGPSGCPRCRRREAEQAEARRLETWASDDPAYRVIRADDEPAIRDALAVVDRMAANNE